MSKRRYFDLLMTMPVDWLRQSAAMPNAHMTRMNVALHLLAIRRKTWKGGE